MQSASAARRIVICFILFSAGESGISTQFLPAKVINNGVNCAAWGFRIGFVRTFCRQLSHPKVAFLEGRGVPFSAWLRLCLQACDPDSRLDI